MAKAVSKPFEKIYSKIWPKRPSGTWPLQIGYYIVNSLLCALAGLVLFELSRSYGVSGIWTLVAITAILSSRWLTYMAGLPLTDSLYLLVISATFLGLRTNNSTLLICVILIGPFAKESFVFIAPIIFFYAHMGWIKKILAFVISGVVVFAVRYWIDHSNGLEVEASFSKAFDTFNTIEYSLKRMFSIKGIGEIFSVIGVFWAIICIGFWRGKNDIKSWGSKMDAPILWLIPAIIIHILLSGDVARMMLFGAPVLVVTIGLILEHHRSFNTLRTTLRKT